MPSCTRSARLRCSASRDASMSPTRFTTRSSSARSASAWPTSPPLGPRVALTTDRMRSSASTTTLVSAVATDSSAAFDTAVALAAGGEVAAAGAAPLAPDAAPSVAAGTSPAGRRSNLTDGFGSCCFGGGAQAASPAASADGDSSCVGDSSAGGGTGLALGSLGVEAATAGCSGARVGAGAGAGSGGTTSSASSAPPGCATKPSSSGSATKPSAARHAASGMAYCWMALAFMQYSSAAGA
mmetsp:Transcript_19327/g.60083  ORF Transcript_19327/g.60083 Transcript_19327/m.60083 type:complete len:240 (+) Transcript_19327:262-981(+)